MRLGELKTRRGNFFQNDKNPLENIGALKKLSGVIVRGRWLSKDDITEKLNEIATK